MSQFSKVIVLYKEYTNERNAILKHSRGIYALAKMAEVSESNSVFHYLLDYL